MVCRKKGIGHVGILLDGKLDNMLLGIIIEVLSRMVNRIFKSSSFVVLQMEELHNVMKKVVALKMMVGKKSLHLQRGRK